MKKIITIVSVLFALTSGLFAKGEELTNISAIFPNQLNEEGMGCVGFEVRSNSFSSDMFGYSIASSFSVPTLFSDLGVFSCWVELDLGLAVRILNSEKFALTVTPGGFFQLYTLSPLMLGFVGINADFALDFKLTDSIYLTGGVLMDYSLWGFALVGDLSVSGEGGILSFAPRIGITFKK